MVEIHNTVAKVFENNKENLEIYECKDEFSELKTSVTIMVLILKIHVMRFL